MKVISATRTKLVLKPSKKDENWRSFIFDVGIVPDKPTPARIEIQKKIGKYQHTWSMSWKKFLRQTCVGDIVIIEKKEFVHNYQAA